MPKLLCSRCGSDCGTAVHSNAATGADEVCDQCQAELHTAWFAARAGKRAAFIAAQAAAGKPASPSGGAQ